MKKRLLSTTALVVVLAMALVGCGGQTPAEPAQSGIAGTENNSMEGSVAMVLSGLVTDKAFNQFTYEGMTRAGKELGIKTAYKENVTQDEQVEVIRRFCYGRHRWFDRLCPTYSIYRR